MAYSLKVESGGKAKSKRSRPSLSAGKSLPHLILGLFTKRLQILLTGYLLVTMSSKFRTTENNKNKIKSICSDACRPVHVLFVLSSK